jgi:2-polyprenyl-6-methoxyphenol hydroxylase-like FAD-dependent oxidoreductase
MKNKHAIVIGASMAGLVTARVLSDYFEQVTVLERDELPATPTPRKSVPQGQHLHALLAKGRYLLNHYFPGLTDELVAQGALEGDPTEKTNWFVDGGYRHKTKLGHTAILLTRPLVETTLRGRVLGLPNLSLVTNVDVKELLASADKAQVLGVKLEQRQAEGKPVASELYADLVVDCAGRGSAAVKWLAALGYAKPAEETIKVDLAYATRTYRRRPEQGDEAYFISPTPPHEFCGAGAFPVDGNRWVVTLAGYFGQHPPADENGFNEFARNLPAPDIYNLIKDSEPLTEIVTFKYPFSLRRRYEALQRHPEGYLVLGDAVCSFNPIYGQGMTSASLQADALNTLLAQAGGNLQGLWRRFYPAASKAVDGPWQLAAGADFAYPQAQGNKPAGTDFINRYIARLQRATHHDPVVHAAFIACTNLLMPTASLFAPDILFRVWRHGGQRHRASVRPASATLASSSAD